MRNTLKDYLRKVKSNKKRRLRSISVLLLLSLVVSGNVFWLLRQTGMTLGTDTTTDKKSSLKADPMSSTSVAPSFILKACDCINESSDAISHSDGCAYKSQLKQIASDHTAEELFDIWTMLPADAQEFVLTYLGWQSETEKRDELKALIDSGNLTERTLRTYCDKAVFSVRGEIPSTAKLNVVDPAYTDEEKISYVNPNDRDLVRWSMIYDISVTNDGSTYTLTSPVTLTAMLPSLTSESYDPETMFFYVVHLDETTGEELSRERVYVVDNTITFTATGFSPYLFYSIDMESEGGERILGTNWIELRDSGYFTYWEQFLDTDKNEYTQSRASLLTSSDSTSSNDKQIDYEGEKTESKYDDGVEVSKTIAGTGIENVFDITLTVTTKDSIEKIYKEPDMAVVIVMDISQTMQGNFGNTTRYKAAMDAAEGFVDKFTTQSGGVSRIGYVAFNTDAHKIFDLSPCSTTDEATALKNQMRQKTGTIINADGYDVSHSRFTNIEAGLRMGYDMLADAKNEHKYIIFLSDGFPTTYMTYIKSGYSGYDPYTSSGTPGSNGVFYDYVTKKYCQYGTSYSDKAAVRAREMATTIKNSGVEIFSIGVDVGGQTIKGYIDQTVGKDFSVVDRTSTTYEIGSADSQEAYKNWLKNSIGSGFYYDSTNAEQIKAAYDDIFKKILVEKEESSKADWVTEDPLPLNPPEQLEFIGFYDQNGELLTTGINLSGSAEQNGENTATFIYKSEKGLDTIIWDLKLSGYTVTRSENIVYYSYKLVYRVRLKNEHNNFVEGQSYDTNAPTHLKYRVFSSVDGVKTLSEVRQIYFAIPQVHGYLAELTFSKVDPNNVPLAGAEFTLKHDDASCPICRGDGKSFVGGLEYTAVSTENGTVTFERVPSGHTYILLETKAPPGYVRDNTPYKVNVAYDELTWDRQSEKTIINRAGAEFPSTGGRGTMPYIFTGAALIATSVVCGYIHRRKRERRGES